MGQSRPSERLTVNRGIYSYGVAPPQGVLRCRNQGLPPYSQPVLLASASRLVRARVAQPEGRPQ